MPEEVYIKRKEMKEALATLDDCEISAKKVLEKISERCKDEEILMKLTDEADDMYTEYRYNECHHILMTL